eukprot:1990567-Rhodomonas_salina.1
MFARVQTEVLAASELRRLWIVYVPTVVQAWVRTFKFQPWGLSMSFPSMVNSWKGVCGRWKRTSSEWQPQSAARSASSLP